MSAYPRLYRSRRHKVIAGVAAGLADRFTVPIWLSRLVWILLLLPGGLPGVVPYASSGSSFPKSRRSSPSQCRDRRDACPAGRQEEYVVDAQRAPVLRE